MFTRYCVLSMFCWFMYTIGNCRYRESSLSLLSTFRELKNKKRFIISRRGSYSLFSWFFNNKAVLDILGIKHIQKLVNINKCLNLKEKSSQWPSDNEFFQEESHVHSLVLYTYHSYTWFCSFCSQSMSFLQYSIKYYFSGFPDET